jgi:hypothetical protein
MSDRKTLGGESWMGIFRIHRGIFFQSAPHLLLKHSSPTHHRGKRKNVYDL